MKHQDVKSRNENFTEKTATKIWREIPSEHNPYISVTHECFGYDIFELMKERSFIDVLYLLFRGELPSENDAKILETLMIGLINPGPRHNATRAAMNTAIGKANPMHILPVGLSVLGGKHLGGQQINHTIRFFNRNLSTPPEYVVNNLRTKQEPEDSNSNENAMFHDELPGFGRIYGGIDRYAENLVNNICSLTEPGPALLWGTKIHNALSEYNAGWTITGLCSAVFSDLHIPPQTGGSLFQILGAPGIAAHGLEVANKPFTAMPFVKDEDYVIEE